MKRNHTLIWALGIAGVAIVGTGCRGSLQGQLINPVGVEAPKAEAYPEANGVYLLKELRARMESRWGNKKSKSEWLHHDVFVVLTEGGLKRADYKIWYSKRAKVKRVRGRTIAPDGTIHPLDPTQIRKAEVNASQEELGLLAKVFPMPRVEVGSIVEVEYVIEYPFVPTLYPDRISDEWPIQKYRVELEGTSDIYYKVMSYDVAGAKPWKVDPGSWWTLSFELDDVPGRPDEEYMASYKEREPYWCFSVQAFVKDGNVVHVNSKWDNAVRWRGRAMYHDTDKHFAGYDVKVDTSECAKDDTECKVQAAVQWVTKKLPMRGFNTWPGRKIKSVLTSKEASNVEKARVLQRILKDMGIEARFALYYPYLRGGVDKDFPEIYSLYRVALLVNKQGNLTQDLWLAPGCEFCAVGQVPYWMQETEALVIDYEYEALVTKPKYTARFQKIVGTEAAVPKYVKRYDVKVTPEGDAHFDVKITQHGQMAQAERERVRKRKPETWKKKTDKLVKDWVTQGKLRKHGPSRVDADKWRAERDIAFDAPGFAVRDGDTLVVPLSFLRYSLDDRLKHAKRREDIVLTYPDVADETATIHVPEGWRIKSLPEGARADGFYEVRVEAKAKGDAVVVHRTARAKLGRYDKSTHRAAQGVLEVFRSLRDSAITFERAPGAAAKGSTVTPAPAERPGAPKSS